MSPLARVTHVFNASTTAATSPFPVLARVSAKEAPRAGRDFQLSPTESLDKRSVTSNAAIIILLFQDNCD